MQTGLLLMKLLPERLFLNLRKTYHKIKKIIYPKLTEKEFIEILTLNLGLRKGDTVFIHSSVENLNVGFSDYKLLDILLDVVGEEGTLVFPAWHFNQRAEDYLKSNEIFDVKRSLPVMGFLSWLAYRHEKAFRSLHPTSSCVAIGKHAEKIINDHHKTLYPCDEYSPFYRIINYNGKIIGLGVSTYNLSFIHCVEDVLKEKFPIKTRTDEVFEAKVINTSGMVITVKTKAAHNQVKYNNIPAFIKKYIPKEICCDLKWKGRKFFRADAKSLFEKMKNLAEKNITVYTSKAKIRNF